MQRNRSALMLLAIFMGAGCSSPTSETSELLPVTSPIEVRVHEVFAPEGRSLAWELKTQREYECGNYGIDVRVLSMFSSRLFLIGGIERPASCLTNPDPASANLDLGPTEESEGAFRIVLPGEVVEGVMSVHADSIVVSSGGGGIRFRDPVLLRVPAGSIWGVIGWGQADRSARVDAFLDSLAARGATPVVRAGQYDVFEIDAAGAVDIAGSHGYWNERDYAYRFPGDPAALDPLLDAFGDSLSISVYDDRGGLRYRHGHLR